MATDRPTKKVYVSPKGKIGKWSWINKPDAGNGQFKKNPVYVVNLAISGQEGVDLFERVQSAHDKSYQAALKDPNLNKKGRKVPEAAMPAYYDEETDSYIFSFKMNASYVDKKSGEEVAMRLQCVDSKGMFLEKTPAVGQGSECKVKFAVVPFAAAFGASIRLQLQALQIIKLVEFGGGRTGQDDGWGDCEEDGFAAGDSDFGDSEDEGKGYESEEQEDTPDEDGDF